MTPSRGTGCPLITHLLSEGGAGTIRSTYLLNEPLNLAVNPGFPIQWVSSHVLSKMSRRLRLVPFTANDPVALATATFHERLRASADRLNPVRHEAMNDGKLPAAESQVFPEISRRPLGITVLPPARSPFLQLVVGRSQLLLCSTIEGAPLRTPNFRGRPREREMTATT